MLTTIERKIIQPLLFIRRSAHTQYLNINENNGTREITLCHEKTKNSLSSDMMNHLTDAINRNKDDISLRAIVLSAKGNVFSAGHNLKELQASEGVDHHRLIFKKATELMKSIVQSPVPVIAKVNGFATAAGCQLVATCDMIICSDTSKFSTPGNSLSSDMMNHLTDAINRNKDDISLRAIVLSAKGNVFSAGHNLKELQASEGVDHHRLIFKKATELMKSIVQSPVPVIAKVNGFATAAGCQLVATCDMIICSDTSKFSTPGANFGIFCSTPGIAVGRCVPKSRAMYMLLTGEPLTAQEAYESGLVTKVVPADQLDNEVSKIIDKIKIKSRSVVSLGKQFFYKQIDLSVPEAYKLGENIMVENVNANDGQEGIRSFVEKRKAIWSHK